MGRLTKGGCLQAVTGWHGTGRSRGTTLTSEHLGRSRFRLLLLPLAALLFAAAAAPAQADSVSFAEWDSDNTYDYATPGEVVHRDAEFSLGYNGTTHAKAGSTFTLGLVNPPANVTANPARFDVWTTWPDPTRPFSSPRATTTVSLRAPDALGEQKINVNFAPSGVQCDVGTSCVRAPATIQYTLNVGPRAVSNLDLDSSAGTGADFRWTPSADEHRITRHYVWRYNPATNSEHKEWFVDPGTTSVRDTGLTPGVEYCWNVATSYVNPTTGVSSTTWRDPYCERTNSAPNAPGPVTGPEFDRDDRFPVSWDAASDPDGDAVTYEVERRDADDASWLPVAKGLTSPTADVTPDPRAGSRPSGTWSFRVRAVTANGLTSSWTETNALTKVDPYPPSQPRSTQEPAAPNELGWYKDPVTVTFGGSTDGSLADGSPGSGVASYTDPITLTEDGHQRAEGHAFDRAGNQSFPWSINAPIDRTKPTVEIECPTAPIVKGSGWTTRWAAADATSGVRQPFGYLPLDRSASGTYTVTSPEPVDGAGNVGEADTCTYVVHEAPTKPGVPVVPDFDDDGDFEVRWDASTDADGDAITYELFLKDADSNFVQAPGGARLNEPSHRVEDLTDGTWEFVVRPTDSRGAMGPLASSTVKTKVDRVAPSAPTASTDPAEPVHEGWFKDTVTVAFGGSADPALLDNSPGSGIAGYSGGRTFDTTGEHTATGAATDRAGNRSAETSRSVKVDADAPTVEIACPTAPVPVGSTRAAAWTAGDRGSGLATPAAGSEPLDTASPGRKTLTAPAPRDNVDHEGQTDSCEYDVNTPPVDPGAPRGPEVDRDGTFDLAWNASADADGDAVTYAVERRESGAGAAWEPQGDGLTAAKLRADGTPEGTYDYRVRAFDPYGAASGWTESLDLVKVDGTGPSAPTAATEPASPAEDAGGWFKDSVAVSFGGSSDPALRDGSNGSGLAGYAGAATFDTTGTHTATGFATDHAGNESARTEQTVKVDASAPRSEIACPARTLIVGEPATAAWTASDEGAGLATAASGGVDLDTSSPGRRTATAPAARDGVGHETEGAACGYVVAYEFAGFSSPINGTAVNAGKAGRTYPVKWRLLRRDGSLISDADAEALLSAMQVVQRDTSCLAFGSLSEDLLEEETTADPSLKYDAGSDQFHYNYRAPSTTGCYILGIRNADGAGTRQVNFNFTR